jgi:hypothetical protein
MCDRCDAKLDAKIEELKQRAKDTGPDMLPTIELPIVTYKARL